MNRDQVLLRHILDAITRIEGYTSAGRDTFLTTPQSQDATIRQLEIIGEATKSLSPTARQDMPGVDWKRMAGMRDILVHKYFEVDLDQVWSVAEFHLPGLKLTIQSWLAGK